jgi:exopolysaccharide production protein ExoQ
LAETWTWLRLEPGKRPAHYLRRVRRPVDRDKLAEQPSVGIWVPIIWYAIEVSQSVSRWLALLAGYRLEVDYLEGSPLDRAIYTGLMVVAMLILLTRRIKWGELIRSNRALAVLFLYMLLSIVWSPVPDVSFKRWARALIDLLMVLVVLTDRAGFAAETMTVRRVMCINIALSVIFIKYFRALGTAWDEFGNEMWVGVTTHKNELGQVVMIGGIYFVFELLRNWRRRARGFKLICLGYLILILWLLKGAPNHRSNTAIFGLIIGTALLLGLQLMQSRMAYLRRHFLETATMGAVLLLVVASAGWPLLASGISASGRDLTLTGRTDLWSDLLDIAAENPIIGVGYGSFWIGNTHNLWERHLWGPTQGHNGYIDVYLELGAVGLLILAAVIIRGYRAALKLMSTDFWRGALHIAWLTVLVIHNLSESSYLRGAVDLWFTFLLCTITPPAHPGRMVSVQNSIPAGGTRRDEGHLSSRR